MSIDFTIGFMVLMSAIFVSFVVGVGVGILLLKLYDDTKKIKTTKLYE